MLTILTNHAITRCAERNLSHADVEFIVTHVKPEHRAGVTFYKFRNKDLPDYIAPNSHRAKLVGSTVLACKYCMRYVFTVYRDPKAFKRDDKKQKYDIRDETHYCPCCEESAA